MLTLERKIWNISKLEANILIDKYLDIVEDLEDYISIQNHKNWNIEFLNENETSKLFANLTK